jgi:hypothetical protein
MRTLFPYTTLFRSVGEGRIEHVGTVGDADTLAVDLGDPGIESTASVYQRVDKPTAHNSHHHADDDNDHLRPTALFHRQPEAVVVGGHAVLLAERVCTASSATW